MERIKKAAEILAKEGEYETVKLMLLDVLAEEKNVIILHNLADLLKENDDYEEALFYAKQAVAMEPKTYYPYALLGELTMRLVSLDSAQRWLEQAYTLFESPVVAHNLASIYKHQQRFSEAATYFIQSYQTEDYGLMRAVECFILAGDVDSAYKWIDVIKQDQERFIGEVELGELYTSLGHYQEAAEWYAKGYQHYAHTACWISNYLWVLHQLGHEKQIGDIRAAFLEKVTAELNELPEDAKEYEMTSEEMQEEEQRLRADMEQVRNAHLQASISYEDELYIASRCLTFFCPMHDQSFGEQEICE
ncbi:tetratricopeptide repeat protein [Lysinibacillus sp. NPDC047702]|uniref:tetratricopeptide repeat protein n=1 Tax=unclassified Lysinibacillus TaxID=2636778 RepID=UPI003D092213